MKRVCRKTAERIASARIKSLEVRTRATALVHGRTSPRAIRTAIGYCEAQLTKLRLKEEGVQTALREADMREKRKTGAGLRRTLRACQKQIIEIEVAKKKLELLNKGTQEKN